MHRWTALLLAALLGAAMAVVVMKVGEGDAPHDVPPLVALGSASMPAPALQFSSAPPVTGVLPLDTLRADMPPGTPLPTSPTAGDTPPTLSKDAPVVIRLGVVLVRFRGAEGAERDQRSRDAALKLAKELRSLAEKDFSAAVAKGDVGSRKDAGRFKQGFLLPSTEASVFSLEVGQLSEPIETPTGFWVAKRLE